MMTAQTIIWLSWMGHGYIYILADVNRDSERGQEQSVYLTTAPFPIANISTSTFEDQILGMGSMKPVGSYPDL